MEISSNNGSLYSFNCNYIRYKGTVWAFYTNNDNRLVQITVFLPRFSLTFKLRCNIWKADWIGYSTNRLYAQGINSLVGLLQRRAGLC